MKRKVITDRKFFHPVQLVLAILLTALALYGLPWLIAVLRGKSNSLGVGIVNVLLGWTLVGWIIALVMACGPHQAVGVKS